MMDLAEQKKTEALKEYFIKFKSSNGIEPKLMVEQYEYFIVYELARRLLEENQALKDQLASERQAIK